MKLINFNDRLQHTDLVLKGKKTMKREYITYPEYYKDTPVYGFNIRSKKGEIPKLNMHDDNSLDIKGAYIKPKYEVGEILAIAQNYRDVDDFYADAAIYKYIEREKEVIPKFDRLSLDDLVKWEKQSFSLSKEKGWKNKKYVKADLMPYHIRITNIGVEPIQSITEEDCFREGIIFTDGKYNEYETPKWAFEEMYKGMYGKEAFDSNFYVFVYTFELI